MNINSSDSINNIPILKIRDYLKTCMDNAIFNTNNISYEFGITTTDAKKLINELVKLDYVGKRIENDFFEVTEFGRRFAKSTAAKPISRRTAEKKLSEFLERVRKVNTDKFYLS